MSKDMRNIIKPTEADFNAADQLLLRTVASMALKPSGQDKLRHSYASLCAQYGVDKFMLRFGLREPSNPLEELEFLFFSEQITDEEYRSRLKAFVERPVDQAMLRKFFDEYAQALQKYSDVLQLIVEIATDQHEQDAGRREAEVDAAIAKLDEKFDISGNEISNVFEFLSRIQTDRSEPIRCGEYTGESAHLVASIVFLNASKIWTNCKETSRRSCSDPSYLYAIDAPSLFYKCIIVPKKLPNPNDLAAIMRSEEAKALMKFAESRKAVLMPGTPARTVQPVHFEDFNGHQFERLVFAYHLRTDEWRTLDWCGQSGGDQGRDIWGERRRGGTLCIQCANRKSVTATKMLRDIDKMLSDKNMRPDAVLIVCASNVSARLRDKVKKYAEKHGIAECHIWSGSEFEERLRRDTENLLKRFMDGETFPEDPDDLCRFTEGKFMRKEKKVSQASRQTLTVSGSNNSGIIANQVNIRAARGGSARPIILPGSIGADPPRYNYVEYLIKRLTKFREAGASYGQQRGGRIHSGVTRKILERQFGGLPKDLPVDRFADICSDLQRKIENTAMGRSNRKKGARSYHSFDEHGNLAKE